MKPELRTAEPHEVRALLLTLSVGHGESLAALSRLVGKNAAYLQQFVTRGSPERLPEDVREKLARYFEVDERLLGARMPYVPAVRK